MTVEGQLSKLFKTEGSSDTEAPLGWSVTGVVIGNSVRKMGKIKENKREREKRLFLFYFLLTPYCLISLI